MLFIRSDGKAWGKDTSSSFLTTIIKRVLGSTSTMGISKFGIINLMDADISDSIITEITDAKSDVLKDCIKQRNKYQNEKYINSHLCKIDTFYKI